MTVAIWIVLALLGFAALFVAALVAYVLIRYGKHIHRIFEEKPLFLIEPSQPDPDAEPIYFESAGGRKLAGSYLRCTTPQRRGVILFCHEFGANRWLFGPYVGRLRNDGYDLCSFDFCNHGDSDPVPGYEPLQWVTEHEVADVLAAARYLKQRSDADPAGIGIFGVSKGGGAALVAAAREPSIRAIITDGAFPTHGTVVHYELRFVEIFVDRRLFYGMLPRWFYGILCEWTLFWKERRWHVRYARIERAMRRLAGRPLLMIHGGRDNYINRDIVDRFFALAGKPKELWVVPKAKHNKCVEIAGDQYHARVAEFYRARLPGELSAPTATESPDTTPATLPVQTTR